MKLQKRLEEIYKDHNPEWINKSGHVLLEAKKHNLAICGSVAIAIARKKAIRPAGDIDFVAGKTEDAFAFVRALQAKLMEYQCYWSIQINNKTEFCPPGSILHIRFNSPFWMPICIMVIPEENFKFWRTDGGFMVQDFRSVLQAAKEMQDRDNKPRDLIAVHLSLNPEEEEATFSDEMDRITRPVLWKREEEKNPYQEL